MKKISSLVFIFVTFILPLVPQTAFAVDNAVLEFAIAVPNPVTAGDVVNFQAVAINSGSDQWLKGSYYWEAEIYDVDKQYISKTQRVTGDVDVKAGESTATNLSFAIPQDYGGFYFFKIYLTHNNQRVAESAYQIFKIIERPIMAGPPPGVALGGSVIASYQDPNLSTPKDAQGNTIFNLVGKTDGGTYLFNSVNNHTADDSWKTYILLGSYTTARGNVNLGDVSPNFSALTLSGRGMRGIEMNVNPAGALLNNTRWSLVGGKAVTAKSGSDTSNGTYERDIYGGNVSVDLPNQKAKATAGVIIGLDNISSLSTDPLSSKFRGATLKAQSNQVAGTALSFQPWSMLKLSADFSFSEFKNDVAISTSAAGSAQQLKADVMWNKLTVSGSVRRTSPNFISFGAPGITSDRLNFDLQTVYKAADWSDLSANFNQFSDNLGKDPKKTTSVQRAYSLAPSFTLPKETRLTTNFTQNTTQGSSRDTLNNVTQSASLGVTKSIAAHSLSATVQNSNFKDLTGVAHNLDTNTLGLSANLTLSTNLRLSLGNSGSFTKDKFDGHRKNSNTQSASVNMTLVPSKLSGQIWGTSTESADNGSSPAKSQDWSANTEFTLQVMTNLAITLGAGYTAKEDLLTKTTTSSKAINARTSWNF